MHDGQRTRGDQSTVRVDDVLTVDLPDDGFVDREYLGRVFADPQKYLTPRPIQARREAERALQRQSESVLARRCKQTGLLVSVTLLITAVVAAAVLAGGPKHPQVQPADAADGITGVEALGAFTVTRHPSADTQQQTPTNSTTPETPVNNAAPSPTRTTTREPEPSRTTQHNQPAADDAATSAAASGTTGENAAGTTTSRAEPSRIEPSATPTTEPSDKLDAVRRFYNLVTTSPVEALGMLAPALLDGGPGKLLDAWQSLDDVRIQKLSERPDGSVLAVLTMLRPDGQRVRVTQVLHFAGDAIDHVQLLSAQHF